MRRTVRRSQGFTIIEVMITVGIVGILAAIALPAYQDSVTRGKLIDMTVRLGDYRAQQEKWFLDNRDFRAIPAAGSTCGVTPPAAGPKDPFKIDCSATLNSYTITATGQPAGGMSNLFQYQVTETNSRSSSGPSGWSPGSGCWALRKDGSCQ